MQVGLFKQGRSAINFYKEIKDESSIIAYDPLFPYKGVLLEYKGKLYQCTEGPVFGSSEIMFTVTEIKLAAD